MMSRWEGRGDLKGVYESRILCLLCENEECSIWMEWGAGEEGLGGLSQFPDPLLTDH